MSIVLFLFLFSFFFQLFLVFTNIFIKFSIYFICFFLRPTKSKMCTKLHFYIFFYIFWFLRVRSQENVFNLNWLGFHLTKSVFINAAVFPTTTFIRCCSCCQIIFVCFCCNVLVELWLSMVFRFRLV